LLLLATESNVASTLLLVWTGLKTAKIKRSYYLAAIESMC